MGPLGTAVQWYFLLEPLTEYMADSTYQRFAKARGYDPQALYFGDDHLLVASGTFRERYRRMYYRDIEALSIADSKKFLAVLISLIAAIGFFAWLAWANRNELGSTPWLFIIPMGILFGLLILHIVRGPTVHCVLRTGVQTLRLTSITRRKKAERFEERLIERANQYQSPFDLATFRRFLQINRNTPPPMPLKPSDQPPPMPAEDTDSDTPPPLNRL